MATTPLTDVEIRILGSLMEKALSTPDYYPLSLNGLTNACNQKSSRDPVVVYDEHDVQSVLAVLEEKKLVEWGLAQRLDRLPGRKESRYTQLLGGAPETVRPPDQTAPPVAQAADSAARLDQLESEVARLRSDIDSLRETLKAFKAQFD